MRKLSYMRRAAKRFLEGTRCKHPIEAVEKGVRTLEEWVDCLNAERELERQMASALRRGLVDGKTDAKVDRAVA